MLGVNASKRGGSLTASLTNFFSPPLKRAMIRDEMGGQFGTEQVYGQFRSGKLERCDLIY